MNVRHRSVLACLVEAQDGECPYCEYPLPPIRTVRDQRNPMRPTVDHVWPTAEGAPDAPGNFLAVHARCNEEKGSLLPTEEQLAALERVNRVLGWPMPEPITNPLGLTSAEEAMALLATVGSR